MESVIKQWRKSASPILSTSHCEFNGTRLCTHARKVSPGTHLLVYKTNSTFIVSTIIDLRFFAIDRSAFSQAPYKLSFHQKHFYARIIFSNSSNSTFIFITHRELVNGSFFKLSGSFFKLSFCAFICLCNNSLIS